MKTKKAERHHDDGGMTPVRAEHTPRADATLVAAAVKPLDDERCLIAVKVVPNAKRTLLDGMHDGAVKLRLAALPVDGRANEALLAWLAHALPCAKRDLRLRQGQASTRKLVEIDRPAAVVRAWLMQELARRAQA